MKNIITVFLINTNKYIKDGNIDFELIKSIPFLNQKDIENSKRFKTIEGRLENIFSTYFKNKYLDGNYYIDNNKKPLSDKCFFNISHSKNYVIFSFNKEYEIGIDIECIKKVNDEIIEYVSNQNELNYIYNNDNDKDISFLEIWTAKESLLKCIGKGINNHLKDINSLPLNNIKQYENEYFSCKTIKYDNCIISVTIKSNEDFKIEIVQEI